MQAAVTLKLAEIREASRRLVRELGFMRATVAGTSLPPSAVHALIEIGARRSLTATELCDLLLLEKSSVSRMLRKLVEAGEVAEAAGKPDGRVKHLSLTPRGEATLAAIDRFARDQVAMALGHLDPQARGGIAQALSRYADALGASRTGGSAPEATVEIASGYRPGIVGRAAEMQARYYAATVGFGAYFEAKVAAGLAEFSQRLGHPRNGIWIATRADTIVGTVAVDGEDLGANTAHLRWFIVEKGQRGGGIGRRLLEQALAFCDAQNFAEVQLWTFRGLDAARRLYEGHGFVLVEETPGRQWGGEVIEQRFVRRRPDRLPPQYSPMMLA